MITVTTATIPGREQLLLEAIASVHAQTLQPEAHLIRMQAPPGGALAPAHLSHQRNQLLAGVQTTWTAILDDDDVYLPHHFETIAEALHSDADVVYTFAGEGCVAREDVTGWDAQRLVHRLELGNCISSNSAVRTETVRAMGGWDERYDRATGRFPTGATFDDWDLWLRLAKAGAKFCCVPVPTWDYRHGNWMRLTG